MQNKQCFLIIPFEKNTKEEYERNSKIFEIMVKPVIEDGGYHLAVGENGTYQFNFNGELVASITGFDLIILDLRGWDLNLIADQNIQNIISRSHTILIIPEGEELPFDIEPDRAIYYSIEFNGPEKFKQQLKQRIADLDVVEMVSKEEYEAKLALIRQLTLEIEVLRQQNSVPDQVEQALSKIPVNPEYENYIFEKISELEKKIVELKSKEMTMHNNYDLKVNEIETLRTEVVNIKIEQKKLQEMAETYKNRIAIITNEKDIAIRNVVELKQRITELEKKLQQVQHPEVDTPTVKQARPIAAAAVTGQTRPLPDPRRPDQIPPVPHTGSMPNTSATKQPSPGANTNSVIQSRPLVVPQHPDPIQAVPPTGTTKATTTMSDNASARPIRTMQESQTTMQPTPVSGTANTQKLKPIGTRNMEKREKTRMASVMTKDKIPPELRSFQFGNIFQGKNLLLIGVIVVVLVIIIFMITWHNNSTPSTTETRTEIQNNNNNETANGRNRAVSEKEVEIMVKNNNYFDNRRNKIGDGFPNQFEGKQVNDNKVVIDYASQLTWLQDGSDRFMKYSEAETWLTSLNQNNYAGHNDWRLPNLLEAMSLVEPEKNSMNLYIDPVFNRTQRFIWTSDQGTDSLSIWVVNFTRGECYFYNREGNNYVRAVRNGL